MTLLARTSAAVTDERGGVLVMFALFAPVAILFVALNVFVDLLYGYLDPRIRLA